jgi:hypothetical protein
MYISPTGNVGIGTSTPSVRLDLGNNVGTANTANQIALYGGGQYGFGVSAGHLNYISGGAHSFYNTATSATQMLITSDGNLLLGTTDNGSGAKLVFFSTTAAQQLKAAGTAPAITFSNTITSPTIGGVLGAATGANQFITGTASGDMVLANQFNTGALIFGTSNTERMRILSGGQLNINSCVLSTQIKLGILQTQNNHVTYLYVNNGSGNASVYARIDSTGNAFAYFDYSGTVVGSITTNGSTTSYNITSDYRLKQDFKNYKALDLISAIKTYDYEWKSDKSRMYGVIAHELQEVIPYAVTGKKDGEQMQGVDYSKIVPILIKSIQELKAEIETLKNK